MKQRFINIIFVCLSLTAIGFSLWKVTPFTVSEGTYIGIIVSLLCAVITFAIGYQILNVIELRKEIKKTHEDNQILQNKNAMIGNELMKMKKEMVETQKMQNNKEQENYYMLSSLIEYNFGQSIQTCLTAFSFMHKALLYSLNTGNTDGEWIFKWLRTFIVEICKQSFPFSSISTDADGNLYISDQDSPVYKCKYSDTIDNYCSNIYETDLQIRNHINYISIKYEYNRVMEHFRNRIEQVKKDPTNIIGELERYNIINK